MTKRHFLLVPLLFGGLFASNLSAAAVFGTFNLNAIITVDATTITFQGGTFDMSGGTDDFATTFGVQIIHDLNIAAQPVGSDFTPFTFIEFINPPGTTLPDLMISRIDVGLFGSAECGLAPAPGQECNPPNPGGSPFDFLNTSTTSSVAFFTFRGITDDGGLSTWKGLFTAQFVTQSFQDVLAALSKTGGKVGPTSISAQFRIDVDNPVPEPGTFALIGMGLIMATIAAKRLKKS